MKQHSKFDVLVNLRERDRIIAEAYMVRSEFLASLIVGACQGVAKAFQSLAHLGAHRRSGLAH